MYVYIYIYVYECMCVYIYINKYMHAYICSYVKKKYLYANQPINPRTPKQGDTLTAGDVLAGHNAAITRVHSTTFTLHFTPSILHPTLCTPLPTPRTQKPCTLHPTP